MNRWSPFGLTLNARLGAPPALMITLPSRPTSFASSAMPPSRLGDAGQPAHLLEQRLGERRRRDALVRVPADRALAGDHRVGVLVDLREDGAERRLDRVGEDVRAADHRDAEHDRDRGQRRAQLAAEQSLERDSDHEPRRAHHFEHLRRLAPVSSCTISPSARKRMRSAIAAARASCVTITVVWP